MIEEIASFGSIPQAVLNIKIYRAAAQSTKISSAPSMAMSLFTLAKMLKYLLLYYSLMCKCKLNFYF